MEKSNKHLTQNCDAVSEVIGELLMTAVAVLAFGVIAVFMLSYQGPSNAPHVDIDGWVDVDTDTIYFRHSGGEVIDIESLRIILNINGYRRELSPNDVSAILGSNTWELGDSIIINTYNLWGTLINENDNISSTIVNGRANMVIESGTLLGEEVDFITLRPDTTAPFISSVANGTPETTSVTITWITNELSDSIVKYGTISGTYTLTQQRAIDVTSHSISLTGLTANTTYYYVVNSTDPSGNSVQSIEHSFTTAAVPGPVYTIFTPTSALDKSDKNIGSATAEQVETNGDGLVTTYRIPKTNNYDNNKYQEFVFSPTLTSNLTKVLIRINHMATQQPTAVKIKVWDESTRSWHDEPITNTDIWNLDEVDVSAYINTQADINNLKIQYLSHHAGVDRTTANIDYIAAYVEY